MVVVCIVVRLVFMACSVMEPVFVLKVVVYLVLLNVVCLICDTCTFRRSWSGTIFVSSCVCYVFVS